MINHSVRDVVWWGDEDGDRTFFHNPYAVGAFTIHMRWAGMTDFERIAE